MVNVLCLYSGFIQSVSKEFMEDTFKMKQDQNHNNLLVCAGISLLMLPNYHKFRLNLRLAFLHVTVIFCAQRKTNVTKLDIRY